MDHSIVECVIGNSRPQLPKSKNITVVYTENLLWHKETLLNTLIKKIPKKYKYVFWLDTDIIFTNKHWMVESVKELQNHNIIQPFEYCFHMDKGELTPSDEAINCKNFVFSPLYKNRRVWRSFCANFKDGNLTEEQKKIYGLHGHVGFAWGARREIFNDVLLYEKGLIGGGDLIIAYAAANQIPHEAIVESFSDDLENIVTWSTKFSSVIKEKIGYIPGDLYHMWHGDLNKRQYIKRAKDYTSQTKLINEKDENGLYVTHREDDDYIRDYFKYRERSTVTNFDRFDYYDAGYSWESPNEVCMYKFEVIVEKIFEPNYAELYYDNPYDGYYN